MKIRVLFFGRIKNKSLLSMINLYKDRIKFFELKEITSLPKLKPNEVRILLDEKGNSYDSILFSEKLNFFINNYDLITFIVGPPAGFKKFNNFSFSDFKEIISLSKFTFTSELSLLILSEQIYRALTIIQGKNYHKE